MCRNNTHLQNNPIQFSHQYNLGFSVTKSCLFVKNFSSLVASQVNNDCGYVWMWISTNVFNVLPFEMAFFSTYVATFSIVSANRWAFRLPSASPLWNLWSNSYPSQWKPRFVRSRTCLSPFDISSLGACKSLYALPMSGLRSKSCTCNNHISCIMNDKTAMKTAMNDNSSAQHIHTESFGGKC